MLGAISSPFCDESKVVLHYPRKVPEAPARLGLGSRITVLNYGVRRILCHIVSLPTSPGWHHHLQSRPRGTGPWYPYPRTVQRPPPRPRTPLLPPETRHPMSSCQATYPPRYNHEAVHHRQFDPPRLGGWQLEGSQQNSVHPRGKESPPFGSCRGDLAGRRCRNGQRTRSARERVVACSCHREGAPAMRSRWLPSASPCRRCFARLSGKVRRSDRIPL